MNQTKLNANDIQQINRIDLSGAADDNEPLSLFAEELPAHSDLASGATIACGGTAATIGSCVSTVSTVSSLL